MRHLRFTLLSLLLIFVVTVAAQRPSELFISEYVEGSVGNKAIEIANYTGESIDLSTYTLEITYNGQSATTVSIPLEGTLSNGNLFVIANPAMNIEADQTDENLWFNGNDAVVLKNGDVVVDSIGRVDSIIWSAADTTLQRNPDACVGDTEATDNFNAADEWGSLPMDTVSGLKSHASNCVSVAAEPTAAPDDGSITIGEIQGAGHLSPLDGETVLTKGIVTADGQNGFWLQSAPGFSDGVAETSDGIFVFTRGDIAVDVGDEISITATVMEFRRDNDEGLLYLTELTNAEVIIISQGNTLPEPIIIGEGGRIPPNTTIDDDSVGNIHEETVYDPENDGIDFYESLEGMRVVVNDALVVAPTNSRFGETWVVGDGGVNSNSVSPRGAMVISEGDFNPERIQIDDDLYQGEWIAHSTGARFDGALVGVVHYSFGNYEVLVTDELPPSADNIEREVTELTPNDNQLTVATFNVQNLGGTADGTEFAARAEIIVTNLGSPDILMLQEIQDSSGDTNDGVVDADLTISNIAEAVAFIGGPEYVGVEISPVDGQDGGRPGSNIRNIILYNPARVGFEAVTEDGNDTSKLELTCENGSIGMNVNPGRVEPANDAIYRNSRKPLVGMFTFNGETIYLMNLHFRSKIGDGALFGEIQPPEFTSEIRRLPQAQTAGDTIVEMLACDPAANILAAGDMNDYHFSESIRDGLAGDSLHNLMFDLPENERYTVIFQGNANVFDQILVSDNMNDNWSPEFDVVHVNVEFLDAVADHDPAIARFTIGE